MAGQDCTLKNGIEGKTLENDSEVDVEWLSSEDDLEIIPNAAVRPKSKNRRKVTNNVTVRGYTNLSVMCRLVCVINLFVLSKCYFFYFVIFVSRNIA